ncbi:MAG: DUF1697 domain-containing protein [Devosia sp.]
MTTFVALLRGINLGQRQMKNADLKDEFEKLGFENVRTLIASGNVLFDGEAEKGTQARIEKALRERFGFAIGTVLRTQEELKELVKSDPFKGRKEDKDTKLYVTFLAEPTEKPLPMPFGIEGDFEVVKLTGREVFILAFRLPSGRFGLGMEAVWKHFGKQLLWTSRNWNTVVKAAEK